MTAHLYGSSDDLVVIDAGTFTEEFDCYSTASDGVVVATSDGSIVKLQLGGEAVWRATVLRSGPKSTVTVVAARGEDDGRDPYGCPGYSDRVDIDTEQPLAWVALVTAVAGPNGQML